MHTVSNTTAIAINCDMIPTSPVKSCMASPKASAETVDILAHNLATVAQIRGQHLEAGESVRIISDYLMMVSRDRKVSGLRVEEIQALMLHGVKKEYGDFFGINAGTLWDWTVAYAKSDECREYHRRIIDARAAAMLPQRHEKSANEIEAEIKASINRAYTSYRLGIENASAAKESDKGDVFDRLLKSNGMRTRYPVGHPLFDAGDHMMRFLNDRGYAGTLKEIFDRAIQLGREKVFNKI